MSILWTDEPIPVKPIPSDYAVQSIRNRLPWRLRLARWLERHHVRVLFWSLVAFVLAGIAVSLWVRSI